MKKITKNIVNYAIWLDHKKAIVVSRDSKGITTAETLLSDIESHERFKGETSNKNRTFDTSLDIGKKMQNREHEQMHHFYKQILTHIPASAAFALIAGPSEAKYELHKAFSKKKALSHVRIEMKTTAKLTADALGRLLKDRISK